ncbi:MAG: serine/threonine-protein kinase [Terracidiphilus sp.]|jgi:non-specific serine/threonine protein kinase/serine/threonine-protein kinase
MTPEIWARVRALVEAAMCLPPSERAAFLNAEAPAKEVREEAEQLLAFENEAGEIFSTVPRQPSLTTAKTEPSLAGRLLGDYRLIEEIGSGGMGAVYLAERADGAYQQRVALKILQEGIFTPRLVERFEEERQIMARLSHPGIARLLDGGMTPEGRPFLVLEYVEGRPIDQYCEEEKLDTPATLRLFLKVADAVQSAHQQLVLHLDLKPANILVTMAGEPRLLDFGISRVLAEGQAGANQAAATLRLLTPRYASPEQAEGLPLGVASDVFSLATLLYRLLTGRLPYSIESVSPVNAAKIICEAAPLLPSKAARPEVAPVLRGDLDMILLKALRKEPERRYGTVFAFAEDVKRHLASKPVHAHPDSLHYRWTKFAQRNRAGLAVAAMVLIVIAGSVAAVVRAAVVARRASEVAERRLQDERELAHSYIFDLDPKLQEIPGTAPVRVFILKHALKYLNAMSQEKMGDDELAQDVAGGFVRVGQVQADVAVPSMNDRAGAWESMNRAHAIQQGLFDKHPEDLARRGVLLRTTFLMSFLAMDDGDIARADQLAQQAWELGQPIVAAGPKTPRYSTMISVAWDLANNRGGNGGEWNFADPTTALPWLDKMHSLILIYKDSIQGQAPTGTAPTDYLEREAIARAGVLWQLGRKEDARGQFQQARQLSRGDTSRSLVETEVQLVIRYNYADFLLNAHEVKAAEAMAPPLPPPLPLSDSNRSEISQRADMLGQRARINLETGRVSAGKHMMDEALNSFETLYRGDPNDATSMGELAYTSFDLAEEPVLDPVTRKRLYLRVIQVTNPFEAKHPEVLSATMLIAKANLGLAQLTKSSTGPEWRSTYAQPAADGFSRILAAHPSQPEASRLLAQTQALLRSGSPGTH